MRRDLFSLSASVMLLDSLSGLHHLPCLLGLPGRRFLFVLRRTAAIHAEIGRHVS